MSVETSEDLLLSDIEPLPLSAPPSPPPPSHPAPAPSFHQPSVARSWPTSPLPVLASSSQVTARLYSSLQRSREQKVKGYSALHSTSDLSGKARQVSFKLSSPDLTQMSGMADTPPPFSDRLDISEGVESSLCVYPSPGASELGKEEAGLETEQLETNLKDNLDISTAKLSNGRRHIEEMESVRGHLKMMLKTTARSLDEEETMPALSHHLEDDSFESDATTQLLNAPVFPSVSPALPLGGLEDLFPRYSRLRTDNVSISSSETQVLRESLERERARRKHCEKQILSLQNKALQLQQQLALAVSADRKKDIMIEQLDKTLAKVVEGWRRHEQEKSEGVRRLQEEKEAAEAAQARQQEVLARFEQSLSQAAETLDREQKHAQELQNTNKQLELELVKLRGSVEELKQERDRLRAEAEEMRAKTGKLQIQTQASQVQLEQQRDEWRQRENELQQELAVCTDQLEKERMRSGVETQLREEAQTRLQQLQTELEETRRERDATRVDRALDQARFEAQRSQLEVELRLSVEQQVTERLAAIQEENAKNSAKLREQHRKQLLDLSARHERELVAQQDQFRAQLQERDERHQQITQDYDRKLSELHEELISLATTKRRLETQRAELVSRLQGMMRSHWTEALRLLTSQDQIEGTFSPLSLWDGSKPQSSSVHQDTSICGTASAVDTHLSDAPQAVVLHLSRERDQGRGEEQGVKEREESDFGLLNHSHTFHPLEPQMNDTNFTGVMDNDLSALWEKPLGGGEGSGERGKGTDRGGLDRERDISRERNERGMILRSERIEGGRGGQSVNQNGSYLQNLTADSFHSVSQSQSHVQNHINQSKSQNLSRGQHKSHIRNQNENQTEIQSLRLNRISSSPERKTSHTSSSKDGEQRNLVSAAYNSSDSNQALPIRDRATPTTNTVSSFSKERQSELQYYINKLLDRSPGDPLESSDQEEQTVEHRQTEGHSGKSSQWESFSSECQVPVGPSSSPCQREPRLEQLATLMGQTLPAQTTQQLQQLLYSMLRSEVAETDGPVRTNLDQKLSQLDKKEGSSSAAQRRVAGQSRSTQSVSSRGRRTGQQGQRSGPTKVNAWR